MTVALGSCGEERAAADMIGVAVRVHQMADRLVAPAAQRLDHCSTGVHTRRIEGDDAFVGAHGNRVTEALDDRQVVGELAQLVGHAVHRLVDDPRVDDSCRQVEQIPHVERG